MSVNPSPIGGYAAQFFDNNGVILSGGKIYTYAAGSTTPQATYTSASGATPHSNPIVLDSAGRVPGGEIWLTDSLVYKFVIETSNGILIGSYDNITGVNSNFVNYTVQEEVITATAGQTVFNLSTINYTPGTNSLTVYIDGVNQYVGTSYLETDSNTVTFTSGVHVGAEVKFTTAVQSTTGAVDASIVSYDPPFTGSAVTTVEAKLAQSVNVLDFVPDAEHADIIAGVSTYDISQAVRYAIDSLGPSGGTVAFPNGGSAVIGSTVYIPPKGFGVILEGNKFKVVGGGVDTHSIFETGMPGNSVGGSSNWSAPNETVLNEGLVIRNFVFTECGTAIKAFNAIWRSEFSGNWGYTNCTTLLHAKRCFYSKTLSNSAVLGRAARNASTPCYWFEEAVNVQTIVGNSASGSYGGVNKSGIGFLFSGGMSGLHMTNNAAESCVTGVKITGEVSGGTISGWYLELDTVGIDIGTASKRMDIESCYFFSNVQTAITGETWLSGRLSASNSIDPACLVDLSDPTNLLVIELPPQQCDMTTAKADLYNVPANWSVGPAARIMRPAATYDPATGYAATRSLLTQDTNANGIIPLPYAGDVGPTTGAYPPFCTSTTGATSVTVDTSISYRNNGFAAFQAIIADASTTHKMAGFVRYGNTVYRLDAIGRTVTASDNGGYLRLVFGGFTNPAVDDVRVWIG